MKPKKRKKSLVGWTYSLWKEHLFFSSSGYPEDDKEQSIVEIPAIRKYKSYKGGSIKKVRITIEEL